MKKFITLLFIGSLSLGITTAQGDDFSKSTKNNVYADIVHERTKIQPTKKKNVDISIKSNVVDLSVDNDIIYKNNKAYLSDQVKKREELSKEIDALLKNIKKDSDNISVDPEYKKYIEIEDTINNAKKILILKLPIDKFLVKENLKGRKYIIQLQNPEFVSSLDKETIEDLKASVFNDIKDIVSEYSLEEMVEKIKEYSERRKRDYSSLFTIVPFEDFFGKIKTTVAYQDNAYIQSYSYDNIAYMNSLYYIPQRLSALKKREGAIFVYVPIEENGDSLQILRGLSMSSEAMMGPQYCWKTTYDGSQMFFENITCGVGRKIKGIAKIVTPDVIYKKNSIIELDKAGRRSVFFSLLVLITGYVLGRYGVVVFQNAVSKSTKSETEII